MTTEQDKSHLLSEHTRGEIDHWLTKFPYEGRQSASLQALMAAQHQNQGWVSTDLMDAAADYIDVPRISMYEVATFYSMIETQPVARHSVSICSNISCMLAGADDLVAHVEGRLGCKRGESTADGRIFLKQEEECLAACSCAPMMQVDHVYYTDLTPERVDEILDGLD
ncbi:MAG: NADH-quinone oxidoreductase subunit NuoE [Halofilum sp. (in: g-proteobacteria)]